MVQSLSRVPSSSTDSQEIARILRNTEFHNRIHNSPPLVLILSQINPVHAHPTVFVMIHSNFIIPSTPSSS